MLGKSVCVKREECVRVCVKREECVRQECVSRGRSALGKSVCQEGGVC